MINLFFPQDSTSRTQLVFLSGKQNQNGSYTGLETDDALLKKRRTDH
jgi:hypothetical protein